MLLAAHAQGLGAAWISSFEDHMIRRILQMPDSARPMVVIPIGYADEHPVAQHKLTTENVTYIERWGTRIKDFASYYGYYSQHVAQAMQLGKEKLQKFLEKWSS